MNYCKKCNAKLSGEEKLGGVCLACKSKRCSPKQQRANKERKKYIYKCSICKREFTTGILSDSYCSEKCKGIGKEIRILDCDICGKEFKTHNKFKQTCSSECSDILKERNLEKKRKISYYRIFERDGFKCAYCGKSSFEDGVKLHIDHIFPRVKGGKNSPQNLITSCEECNIRKNDRVLPKDISLELWNVVQKRNQELPYDYEELEQEFNKKWK